MTRDKLAAAVAEAERFLKRAKAMPKPVQRSFYGRNETYMDDAFPPKDGGAIRRASMDLTRALADLRRSPS